MRKDAAATRQRILELAAAGVGPRAIAREVGVTDRTVRHHLNSAEAEAELRRLQDERLRLLTRRALDGADGALEVLRAVAEDGAQPAGARVTAARALLDAALRPAETRDLAERVAALEEQLGDAGATPGQGVRRWAG